MVIAEKFESRIQDAIRIKFDPDFPTFSESVLEHNLADLLRSADYGIDPVLSTLLNCTVGGAGSQPLEVGLIAAASLDEKRNALRELEKRLGGLLGAGIAPELVSRVVARLPALTI